MSFKAIHCFGLCLVSDDGMENDDLPQLGLLCHGPKLNSFVSKSSIKPLKKSARYVPLRCNNDGKFTLFDDPDGDEVDIYKAKCTKKQYPMVIKHENETSLCSNLGADGRQTDLEGNIHTVQIGWNVSAVSDDLEIKEMVSMIFIIRI